MSETDLPAAVPVLTFSLPFIDSNKNVDDDNKEDSENDHDRDTDKTVLTAQKSRWVKTCLK